MKKFDAIVIGAGPAGSLAAYRLAGAGWSVLLLDKARFPRHKVCGGGLTERARKEIPFNLTPVIHKTVTWGYLGFRGRKVCKIDGQRPIAHLVDRSTFDDYLRQKAEDQGAECHQGERLTQIDPTADQVTVQTNQASYQARFVIGADGVHSQVARQMGLLVNHPTSLAMEARLSLPQVGQSSLTDGITFDFGTLAWGYGWIFPKRDHLNIGVFRNWPGRRTGRQQLLRFVRRHPELNVNQILDLRAYPGPAGGMRGPRHQGRVLLVGDAAQLADPWLGEGIGYALASARMATETLLAIGSADAPDLTSYSNLIEREILVQFRAARKMAVVVSLFYGLNVWFLKRSPSLQAIIIDLLRGDRNYTDIWANLSHHIPRTLWAILRRK